MKTTTTTKTNTIHNNSRTQSGLNGKLIAPVFAIFTLLIAAGMETGSAQPAHLINGLELVDQIVSAQENGIFVDQNNVEINRYGGSWNSATNPSFIRFADPEQGILPANNTTCSPFVTHLLKHTYNWSWFGYQFFDPIQNKLVKTSSPSSYRYVALIEQEIGFEQQIQRLDQVQPGDIMAIHYLGTTGGHTTVVVDVDWQSIKVYPSDHAKAWPELEGTFYVEVVVMDSSSGTHTDDTRHVPFNNQIVETSGLGVGTMGILINQSYEIIGYTWSLPYSDYETQTGGWLDGVHNRLQPQTERKMVFGRLPGMP
jgi:hypothetical protein